MPCSDMETWDDFLDDPRMTALLEGKTVINHSDGTWEAV